MTTLYVLLGVFGASILCGIAYYIHRGTVNAVALGQRDEALRLEQERVAAMEKAAADARAARLEEFDAKAATATTPDAAAGLLRDATRRRP